jgi:hypothetical protein
MTEKQVYHQIKMWSNTVNYYTEKIKNKNNYFLEKNLVFFKKERYKNLKKIRELQERYPEYFI